MEKRQGRPFWPSLIFINKGNARVIGIARIGNVKKSSKNGVETAVLKIEGDCFGDIGIDQDSHPAVDTYEQEDIGDFEIISGKGLHGSPLQLLMQLELLDFWLRSDGKRHKAETAYMTVFITQKYAVPQPLFTPPPNEQKKRLDITCIGYRGGSVARQDITVTDETAPNLQP